MGSNKVEFEIVANTKDAGKAVLELSRKVNNALKIKSDDKGVKALQTQLGKVNKDLEKAFTDAKKLNLAFNQYDANAAKIKKLSDALNTMPKGSAEYKETAAQIKTLTNANKAMDKYAKGALNEIVKKYGEIKTTDENILGLKTEEVKKTTSAADSTKKEAEAQKQLEGSVKDTNSALEQEQLDAKKAEEQFEATEKARKSGKKQKIDEEPVSKTTVNGVKAKTQEVLSRGMGSTYAELDRYKKDLLEIKNLIQELGDGKPLQALDEEYQKISSELAKIRAEQSALNKESTTFGETVSEDTKPEIIEDVKAQAMEALSKSATDAANSMADLDRRLEELKGAKNTIKELGIPPELSTQYNQLSAEIEKVNEKKKKLKDAADVQAFRTAMQGVLDTTDRVERSMRMDDAKNNVAELIRRYEELKQVKATLEDYGLPREMDSRYNSTLQMLAQINAQIQEYKRNLVEAGTESERSGTKGEQSANRVTQAFSNMKAAIGGASSRISGAFSNIATNVSQISGGVGKLHGVIDRVKSSFNQTAKESRRNFKHLLTNLTKYVFGFRSLFFLVRRLRKGLVEGIKNVVRYEKSIKALKDTKISGIDYKSVNQAINSLRSSLAYLKNAWGAAFAPIITTVTPLLTSLMDAIADAGNYIARFVGALTGQKVVLNATKGSAGDYAKGLDKVKDKEDDAADSAKKLNDRLADFDDLHVLGKDDNDGGSGSGNGSGNNNNNTGTSPNNLFYFAPGENSLADMIKEAWEKADFTKLGELLKDKIIEALQYVEDHLDDIQNFLTKIAKSLGTFLVGLLSDPKLFEKIGDVTANLFNAFQNAIGEFLDLVSKIPLGQNLAKMLNKFLGNDPFSKMGSNINKAIKLVTNNLKEFFKTLDAKKIADAISNFIKELNIKELAITAISAVLELTKLVVNVGANLIVNAAEDIGQKLFDMVFKGWESEANGKKFIIKPEIDPNADAVGALVETLMAKLGELLYKAIVGIGSIFGIDEKTIYSKLNKIFRTATEDGARRGSGRGGSAGLKQAVEDSEDDYEKKLSKMTQEATEDGYSKYSPTTLQKIQGYIKQAHETGALDGTKEGETRGVQEGIQEATPKLKNQFETTFKDPLSQVFADASGLGATEGIETAIKTGDFKHLSSSKTSVSEMLKEIMFKGLDDGLTEYLQADMSSSVIPKLTPSAKKIGAAFIDGFASGTKEGFGDGDWAAVNITDPIVNGVEKNLGIDSPSKVAKEWGVYIIEGLDNGLTEKQSDLETTLETIKTTLTTKFGEAKTDAETKAGEIQTAFDTALTNINTNAGTQLDAVKAKFIDTFKAIKDGIKTPINGIISLTESLVNKVIDGVNGLVKKLNDIPDIKFTNPETNKEYKFGFKIPQLTKVSIPKLAQGAVIPPNKAFMAMLGDQSHGTNIEAPLDTIKQAVAEVMANNGNQEVIRLLQQLIGVVESKNLVIGDKEIGRANARYTNQQRIIRGTSF